MGAALLASFFSPVAMVGALGVFALALAAQSPLSPLSLSLLITALVLAPLIVACSVELFYGWCFGRDRSSRSVSLLGSTATLLAVLHDRDLFALMSHVSSPGGASEMAVVAPIAALISSAAIATAVVTSGVLLVELPLRWATYSFGRVDMDGVARVFRIVVLLAVIRLAWPLIRDLVPAALSIILSVGRA